MRSAFAQRHAFAIVRLCICTCSLLFFTLAAAGELGGSIGATSDYVYRGISQTGGEPALQVDIHYQSQSHRVVDDRPVGGWAVGTWASTTGSNQQEATNHEVDLYVSRNWTINRDWGARLSLGHYFYPQDSRPLRYDYDEVVATLDYQSRVFATVAWSPNVSRYANDVVVQRKAATSYELAAI